MDIVDVSVSLDDSWFTLERLCLSIPIQNSRLYIHGTKESIETFISSIQDALNIVIKGEEDRQCKETTTS